MIRYLPEGKIAGILIGYAIICLPALFVIMFWLADIFHALKG